MSLTAVCHFCRHEFSFDPNGCRALPRVTSDCRPAARTGALVVCPDCCLTQTVVSEDWRTAADEAYRNYAIYEAAGGAEQKVASGAGLETRSKVIVEHLARRSAVPAAGRLLDFGCGNGGFLRAFAERFPDWRLEGAETYDRYLADLQTIAGFDKLHGVDVSALPGCYDAVSLVHVLEHLEAPAKTLAALREKSNPQSLLFVEVPAWRSNPFALMIADHASHFTPATLEMVVNASGWSAEGVSEDWVPKELSLVARNRGAGASGATSLNYLEEVQALQAAIDWLTSTADAAKRTAADSRNFGLFGSAIAATWLYQAVGDRVRFFVDEDPQRAGRTHLGLPILPPDQVPADADVFVGMAPMVASRVVAKYRLGPGLYHGVAPFESVLVEATCP